MSAPIIENEIKIAAKALKKNSAPGWDGISTGLLLLSLPILIPYILDLFNTCLVHGKFPKSWKQGRVCIIHKPGKADYTDVNSYRPISVLPAMSKLFEKILLS